MTRFTVRLHTFDRSVEVRVYKHLKRMQRAGDAYHRAEDGFSGALALSQPRTVWSIRADGSEQRCRTAGVLRFVEGHLTAEIITHESVHMALAIWRNEGGAAPGDLPMATEETFCYLAGELAGGIVDGLYAKGVLNRGTDTTEGGGVA